MNETANRWLIFAREDLQVAEIVLDAGIYNQVCFHAQQCVEKALKGALVRQGHVPPRTHSITDLLSLFPSEWLADLRDDLSMMDDLYIPTRYPDALPGMLPDGLPGRAEAEEALALARAVLKRLIRDWRSEVGS
jgi:HEPN domain-containing protein